MKKLFFAALLPLALAACGPSKTGTTPPTPMTDPLTLSFTGTGRVSAYSESFNWSTSVPLTESQKGQTYNVGTLNADKTVSVSITADQAKSMAYPISSIKKSFFGYCDQDSLKLENSGDGLVYRFLSAHIKGNQDDFNLVPSYRNSSNGTLLSRTQHQFFYVTTAMKLTGTTQCTDGAKTFNLDLQPGWNHVVRNYEYDSANQKTNSDKYEMAQGNTYDGQWSLSKQ